MTWDEHILPFLEDKGHGSVINTPSTSGMKGHPKESIYAAGKSGVMNLTKNAPIEYAHTMFMLMPYVLG